MSSTHRNRVCNLMKRNCRKLEITLVLLIEQSANQPTSITAYNNQQLPLVSALKLQRDFSQLEVMKFDGELSKYAKFVSTFEQTVGAANISVNKKTSVFTPNCQGKAKQLIEHCCLLNPLEGYEKALQLLKEKYGRPNVIARSYCERLTQGLPIKSVTAKD